MLALYSQIKQKNQKWITRIIYLGIFFQNNFKILYGHLPQNLNPKMYTILLLYGVFDTGFTTSVKF
jgi:hypothetical protein